MSDNNELPTIGQFISNWLGVQLPVIPLPQTLRNTDKAIAKIVLACGENLEARVKGNTAKMKATDKINLDGMYRTAEEKRKLENRVGTTKAALEDLGANSDTADAASEIDDDWLNFFARVSEDKSSHELQQLFGRILSGEIRRPGSFSLRTIQLMSTISRNDAEELSRLMSYAVNKQLVPFGRGNDVGPTYGERLFLDELGAASHPNRVGGIQVSLKAVPEAKLLLTASHLAILVDNKTKHILEFSIEGQILTRPAIELIEIANSPPTDIEFLKDVAEQIDAYLRRRHTVELDAGLVSIHIVKIDALNYSIVHTHQH